MSTSIRALYGHLCDVLGGCATLTDLLDAENGIRRMDGIPEDEFRNVLTYGRATRRRFDTRMPGTYSFTVTFTPYMRGEEEAQTAGDFLLADVEEILMQIFDIEQHKPACYLPSSDFVLMRSQFDDFSSEPAFDRGTQAWTQSHRFRFDVVVPTCSPVTAAWCGQCL